MNTDTIHFSTPLPFTETVEFVQRHFDLIPEPKIINREKIAYTPRSYYMQNVTEFKLNDHAHIRVWQHTTQTANGIPKTHIEFIGLAQYDKQTGEPVDTFKIIKVTLSSMLQEMPLQLESLDVCTDTSASFDEVAQDFSTYLQPYKSTFYSHKKEAKVVEKFCLYDKSTKNNLDFELTRLELTKDYSRRRVPVLIHSLSDIEERVKESVKLLRREAGRSDKLLNMVHTYLPLPLHSPLHPSTTTSTPAKHSPTTTIHTSSINLTHASYVKPLETPLLEVGINGKTLVYNWEEESLTFTPADASEAELLAQPLPYKHTARKRKL